MEAEILPRLKILLLRIARKRSKEWFTFFATRSYKVISRGSSISNMTFRPTFCVALKVASLFNL